MITYIYADALHTGAQLAVHQVNCQGVMGAGIAKQVRAEFPRVYDMYSRVCKLHSPEQLLGSVQIVDGICNLYGQLSYGTDRVQTDYTAVHKALGGLAKYCIKNNIKTIAIPYKIGCGLAGGDWDTYMDLITRFHDYVNSHHTLDIIVCKRVAK